MATNFDSDDIHNNSHRLYVGRVNVYTFLSSYRFPKRIAPFTTISRRARRNRVFPDGEEAHRITVARAYAKLFAMERANGETECNRTHKENPLRSRGELSIKLPTGGGH